MDFIGELKLEWAKGYDGRKIEYIDRETLLYSCGNNINFVTESGEESLFPSPGEGVGPVAVHSIDKVFAFAELRLGPKVFIYKYPELTEVSQLCDGAKLEYLAITFSTSCYVATVSGVPEFTLTLWNYLDGTKLCTTLLSHCEPAGISFNPANWRQIFVSSTTEMKVLTYESANVVYVATEKNITIPLEDGTVTGSKDLQHRALASSKVGRRMSLELPLSAVAGLVGEMACTFEDTQDDRQRVVPVSHAWHPTGDIFVGCEKGQLVQIDGETFKASIVHVVESNPSHTNVSTEGVTQKKLSFVDEQSSTESVPSKAPASSVKIGGGSLNTIALHRDGLFVGGVDGIVRQLELSKGFVAVAESTDIGRPITSLGFNTMYSKLAIGSSQGCVHILDPTDPDTLNLLFDQHKGNFVGVECLCPGSQFVVTVRENGFLQVWNLETSDQACCLALNVQATVLACGVLSQFIVVGTDDGHLYFVDLHDFSQPRIIHCIHMHRGPVKQLVFEVNGHYLVSGGNDSHVFVMDGRPSKNFFVYGHTAVDGEVLAISCYNKSGDVQIVVTTNNTEDHRLGATKLVIMNIQPSIVEDYRLFHDSLKYNFSEKAIDKITLNFSVPSYGAVITSGRVLYTLSQSNKNVHKIIIPKEPPKKHYRGVRKGSQAEAMSKDSYLTAEEEYPGHQLPGGTIVLSPHSKWLASAGMDGKLYIRAVGALDRVIGVYPHDYRHGGVRNVAFSADCQYILTTGMNDGVLCCYKWNYTESGQEKAKSAISLAQARRAEILTETNKEEQCLADCREWEPLSNNRPSTASIQEKEKERIQKAIEEDDIYTTPTPVLSSQATWLEIRELEAIKEEDKEYASLKHDLRSEIRDMRRQLQTMMKENEVLPEIEKLGHHEFDLDTEEQARLQQLGDDEVARIREEIEFQNLAKMYLKELIKMECWDSMVVKGRALTAFNSSTEVSNYPMKARGKDEQAFLETVMKRRRIEIAERSARQEITEVPSKVTVTSNEEIEDDEDEGKEKPALIGSMGAQYGGACDLLYSQFELHSREQKVAQIVMLKDAIHRIKEHFNKEFDDVYAKKEQEISKIADRNKRIRKILADLDLTEEVSDPEMSLIEKPERLLVVEDHEVKVERYLTAEQRKKLEEEQKAEEERRLREKGDNARERALDMMMGGVLEIKKEDELKKDVPIPVFMQQKKAEDFSEEEIKLVKEYERKVAELNEEREKYRKQLETELKKLQGMIQDTESNFDDAMHQLFARKVKTELVIYQEELKIIRLQYSLMVEEELESHEREMLRLLDHKRELKLLAERACVDGRKNSDAFREQYDILTAEDKVMDKAFKREFHDVSAIMADQLYKLFRRRPRGIRGTIRGGETPLYESSSGNPFFDRPSSARQKAMAQAGLEVALAELDKESNMPEGLDISVWKRMCHYRRQKIESEHLVKEKALVMADINAFLQRRQEEDDALRHEIEDIVLSISKLKEDRFQFVCNLEIQLLLKQGQVEVDAGDFIHNYKESVLIHRSVVEDLNGRIRALGEKKIASMVESKDFRKGIIQLEWEHKKNLMTIQDLQKKMRDITMMKVTREIQAYLTEEDHEAKKSQEIATLEQTLTMQKKNHEKMVEDRKRIIRELKRTIHYKDSDNNNLDSTLEELNVSVNERNQINEVNADKSEDAGAEKRYQEIVQRRKLVDLAKAQAQEVAVLRAEVERLRMRTFPALVQVEH